MLELSAGATSAIGQLRNQNMIVKPSKRLTVTFVLVLIAVCAGGFYGVIVNLILRLLL
jgi:hypothetical protein